MTARREEYLARIGIPLYERRRGPIETPEPTVADAASADAAVDRRGAEAAVACPTSAEAAVARPTSADAAAAPPARADAVVALSARADAGASKADAWPELEARVAACTRCALHRGRTQTVFGVGRRDAELMVIGEAPGAEEDRQGEPFVGRAGQLLNAMLRAIGFAREDVYIANILKCRPPNNRDPSPEEASLCTEYLREQIALVAPRALLGVGRIAAHWLLQTDSPVGRLRGRTHRFGAEGIPLVVTYHPAYLLRSPSEKAKAWQDLCMIRRLVSAPSAEARASFENS